MSCSFSIFLLSKSKIHNKLNDNYRESTGIVLPSELSQLIKIIAFSMYMSNTVPEF